jgi:hypothetical protein
MYDKKMPKGKKMMDMKKTEIKKKAIAKIKKMGKKK